MSNIHHPAKKNEGPNLWGDPLIFEFRIWTNISAQNNGNLVQKSITELHRKRENDGNGQLISDAK